MELVIGGAFQGKLKWAIERYGLTKEDICDLAVEGPVDGKRCYRHLEALSLREDATPYLPLFKDAVVITREVNGGIVPMDGKERAWRERHGFFPGIRGWENLHIRRCGMKVKELRM